MSLSSYGFPNPSGLVAYGLGAGGGGLAYVMRAFHTIFPTGHVYWTVEQDAPDAAADFAPYPAVDLMDIVILRVLPAQDDPLPPPGYGDPVPSFPLMYPQPGPNLGEL